jgi:NAD(P)-dependent dehydrogenase (short-subunit alcohol dehydrogenase family)
MQHSSASRRLGEIARAVHSPAPPAVAATTAGFASLHGRTALVTGVTDGSMGHGIALALARQGCAVACVDVASHQESLRRACDNITSSTGSATLALTADCTDRADLNAAFAEATEHLGPPRIVVAAVGGMGYTGGRGAGEEVKDADAFVDADLSGGFAGIVQTTQFATYHTCQLAAQAMLKHGVGGRIIVIGSVMSDMGRPGSAACAPLFDCAAYSPAAMQSMS